MQPLDRDQPHGRPQWRFTVFAQDEGGEGLVGYADVQVNLKDINDNAPFFPQGIYVGNVTENGTAGKNDQKPIKADKNHLQIDILFGFQRRACLLPITISF